jgi:hypothetical protein
LARLFAWNHYGFNGGATTLADLVKRNRRRHRADVPDRKEGQ